MPIIIKDLKFGYSDRILFNNINLTIDTSWKLALAGRNGRGKTTFFKLLRGELDYSGSITGVPQTVVFPMDELPDTEDWRVRKELNLMGADPNIMWRPMDTLSGGERTKLMLAHLFSDESIYPLIDEPTNHLDREGREAVASYLASKEGFILVSHDRAFLDRCTDHTLVLARSGPELVNAAFSVWWDNNEQRQESELQKNNQIKKEMASIESAMKKNASWSGKAENSKLRSNSVKGAEDHFRRAYEGKKASKLMSLAKNLENRNEKKLEQKQSLLKDLEREQRLKIEGSTHHDRTPVILKDVSIFRDGVLIADSINLTVGRGQKISIQGRNGCGKTTLIKYLAGLDDSLTASGDIKIAKDLTISYVGQDTSVLKGSIFDLASEFNCDRTKLSTILIKMGFNDLYKDVEELSLGQKKLLYIALSLCMKADIFLWDEPLNYIDVYMRKEIERLVKQSDITIIFVEHDVRFIEEVSDQVVEMG